MLPADCRGPAFPPSPGDLDTFEAFLLCSPVDDDFCQRFPHLSTSWLSANEPIQTWVVEVAFTDLLDTITFRWEIPEVSNGVSLWLLDPARETETNRLSPFFPEHDIPIDFEGTTTFVICSYSAPVLRDQCLPHAAATGFN